MTTWPQKFSVLDNLMTVDPRVCKMFYDNKFAVDVDRVRFYILNSSYSFLTLNRTIVEYTSSQMTDES